MLILSRALTVYSPKNLALCAGNCRLAERCSIPRAFLWLLKEAAWLFQVLRSTPESVTGSAVVKVLFCCCVITVFKMGDSPSCLGSRKEKLKHCLNPQTFFPSARKYCPLVPFCYQRITLTWVQSDVVI